MLTQEQEKLQEFAQKVMALLNEYNYCTGVLSVAGSDAIVIGIGMHFPGKPQLQMAQPQWKRHKKVKTNKL